MTGFGDCYWNNVAYFCDGDINDLLFGKLIHLYSYSIFIDWYEESRPSKCLVKVKVSETYVVLLTCKI